MSEGSNQFRTATIGGFHRQDVLNYLAALGAEHETVLSRLQNEVNQLQAEKDAHVEAKQNKETQRIHLQESLAHMEQERNEALERVKTLKAQLNSARTNTEACVQAAKTEVESKVIALEANLQAVREELDTKILALEAERTQWNREKEQALRTLQEEHEIALRQLFAENESKQQTAEAEAEALRQEVECLRQKASAYDKLKNRTATIELDAHERAQSILDEASLEESRIREAYRHWMRQAQMKYQVLQSNMNKTFAQATGQLEEICAGFQEVSAEFVRYDDILSDLASEKEATEAVETEMPDELATAEEESFEFV